MARHRIVRTMDYNDEYDGYDDVYGHSVDDDNCISPTDAQQWLYDRAHGHQSMSSFIRDNKNIAEEEEGNETDEDKLSSPNRRRDSENFQLPILNDDVEQAKLNSCIDEVRNVVGDTVSDFRIINCAMRWHYDVVKVLDAILNDENDDDDTGNDEKNVSKNLRNEGWSPTTNTSTSHAKPSSIMTTTAKTGALESSPIIKVTTENRRGFETPQSGTTPSPSPVVSGRDTPNELDDVSIRIQDPK